MNERMKKRRNEGREGGKKKKTGDKRGQALILPVSWCPTKDHYIQRFRMFRVFLKINGFFYEYATI